MHHRLLYGHPFSPVTVCPLSIVAGPTYVMHGWWIEGCETVVSLHPGADPEGVVWGGGHTLHGGGGTVTLSLFVKPIF